MTIRTTTTRAAALLLALAYVALTPARPAAADREHQQLMADLRILQEQTQQLQALMTDLGEALKAVNSRIEDQTALERKAFADGKVQMDTMSGDLRVVREKVDETNVRLGTITQELESLRDAMPQPGAFTATTPSVITLWRYRDSKRTSVHFQKALARTKRSCTSRKRWRGTRKTWRPSPPTIVSSPTMRARHRCPWRTTSAGRHSSVSATLRARATRMRPS
jgi:hypothetical protein